MKKWTVTIEAQDEASALPYLQLLNSSFKAAALMKLPMEATVIDDPARGEKLVCTPAKKRWSWLRRG
jgi:hypothetical protein